MCSRIPSKGNLYFYGIHEWQEAKINNDEWVSLNDDVVYTSPSEITKYCKFVLDRLGSLVELPLGGQFPDTDHYWKAEHK